MKQLSPHPHPTPAQGLLGKKPVNPCGGFLLPCLDGLVECSSCTGGKPTVFPCLPQVGVSTKFLASKTARSGHVTGFHQLDAFTKDLVRN